QEFLTALSHGVLMLSYGAGAEAKKLSLLATRHARACSQACAGCVNLLARASRLSHHNARRGWPGQALPSHRQSAGKVLYSPAALTSARASGLVRNAIKARAGSGFVLVADTAATNGITRPSGSGIGPTTVTPLCGINSVRLVLPISAPASAPGNPPRTRTPFFLPSSAILTR